MKAMILAAGLGTRLGALTGTKPKPLIELDRKTLLERAVEQLRAAGVDEIVVNVHHHAGQVMEFLGKNDFGLRRIELSDESDQLLDTGGALQKASWFFPGDEDFFVYNVDVVTDLDLQRLLDHHRQTGSLASLAVRERPSVRQLLFNAEMHLKGWMNRETGKKIVVNEEAETLREYAFSGIHVINPQIFPLIRETGNFSLITLYLRLAASHHISGYCHNHTAWFDVGRPEDLQKAEEWLGTDSHQK